MDTVEVNKPEVEMWICLVEQGDRILESLYRKPIAASATLASIIEVSY